ncbi:MAG TPA: hypothetical protein VD770_02660 [Coxiellaceae bacterium]|nr:hypothetical protein [Coxiellaceae bacterium]
MSGDFNSDHRINQALECLVELVEAYLGEYLLGEVHWLCFPTHYDPANFGTCSPRESKLETINSSNLESAIAS